MSKGSSKEVKEPEAAQAEDEIEEVEHMSDLHRSSERGPLILKRVKYLCKSLSLPVPITVVETK